MLLTIYEENSVKKTQLFQLSKFCYREVFLDSRMLLEHTQQDRLLEKIKDNTKYLQEIDFMIKFMSILYSISLILFPVQIFNVLRQLDTSLYDLTWLYFITGTLISIFFIFQMLLALFFSFISLPGLSKASYLSLIQTFPLTTKEVKWTVYFTHLRAIFPHLLMIFFIYPLATFFSTKSVSFTLANLFISIINIIVLFPLVVLFVRKVQISLTKSITKTQSKGILRILVIFIILIISMVVFAGASFITELMKILLRYQNAPFPMDGITIGLSLFPGFSGLGFLSAYLFFLPTQTALPFTIWPIIGGFLQILFGIWLNVYIYRHLLDSHASDDNSHQSYSLDEISLQMKTVEIRTKSPIRKFMEMNWKTASRDLQVLMWFVTGAFLKILVPAIYGEILSFNLLYIIMAAYYFVIGISRTEITSAKILSSVSYHIRDQACAKVYFLVFVQAICESLLPLALFLHGSNALAYFKWFSLLPLSFALSILVFEFYILLFGKSRYKYRLGAIKFNAAVEKWVLFIGSGIVAAILVIIGYDRLLLHFTLYGVSGIIWGFSAVLLYGSYRLFNHLFPKEKSFIAVSPKNNS